MDEDFKRLMGVCGELAQDFSEGLVFIGGIAVYLHAFNHEHTRMLAETTHDADVYVSLKDLSDLRDQEELTSNKRLSKHQIIKNGFEVDVYTERQAGLRLSYDEVMAHSETLDVMRVACLEHLLVLKLGAYKDRKSSAKGDKDGRDLLRLAAVMDLSSTAFRKALVEAHLDSDDVELLEALSKSSLPVAMTGGNVHEARALRHSMNRLVEALKPPQATDHPRSVMRPKN